MTNATSTTLVLAIPLLLLAITLFGILKSRAVFLVMGVFLFFAIAVLLTAGSFASQIAVGHGSSKTSGWENWSPLPLWAIIGPSILLIGTLIRPKKYQEPPVHQELETRLPTMRESQTFNKPEEKRK